MNKLVYIAVSVLMLSACANAKKEEKVLQKEVLDSHEKVMANDEKAMINKMKLDTLIKKADSLKLNKQEAVELSNKLVYADEKMSDWMGKLSLDNSGKNHDDIMKYWEAQKIQVKQIDSMLVDATAQSEAYLTKKR